MAKRTVANEIRLVAERIVGEWAARHGTLTGPREASLVQHVLTELGQAGMDDLRQRWPAHPSATTDCLCGHTIDWHSTSSSRCSVYRCRCNGFARCIR